MADWRSKDFDPFADNQTASGDWRSKDFDPFAEESASPPVAPVAPVASAPVAFSDRLREGVRSVVRNSRPYVEGAGMALGGVLAAPAAIASGPDRKSVV